MKLLLVLFTAFVLGQAPPATKAEQLQDAARKGDAAAVKKLLDEGVDVNTKYRYDATALFYACDAGHVEVVKVLLDKGADLTVKDTFYGFTPLMLAVSPARKKTPAHTEIAKLLIAKGAPDDRKRGLGRHPPAAHERRLDPGGIQRPGDPGAGAVHHTCAVVLVNEPLQPERLLLEERPAALDDRERHDPHYFTE